MTLWEILSLGAERPFSKMSNHSVIENAQFISNDDPSAVSPGGRVVKKGTIFFFKKLGNDRKSFENIFFFKTLRDEAFSKSVGKAELT